MQGATDMTTTFAERFIVEAVAVLKEIDADQIESVARGLSMVREQSGRLFVVAVGELAGLAEPMAADFREVCGFDACVTSSEAEAPFRPRSRDGVLLVSVNGGSTSTADSGDLVRATVQCRKAGASVFGIVGHDGGYVADAADACVVVPPMFLGRVGAHTRGACAVVWQLLISHPVLRRTEVHWEQLAAAKPLTRANRRAPAAMPSSIPT